jgi:hypothetical protein
LIVGSDSRRLTALRRAEPAPGQICLILAQGDLNDGIAL